MYNINETESCVFKVNYEIAVPNKSKKEAISAFSKEKVPGFRLGKAPKEVIEFNFKEEIKNYMKNSLARAAIKEVSEEKDIKVFDTKFDSLELNDDKFTCGFELRGLPKVEVKKYKNFEIPKPQLPSEAELSEMILQKIRSQNGQMLPFSDDDFIQDKDSVILNFSAFDQDNNLLLKKEGEIVQIGSAEYSCFNENLLGMKNGEKREFSATVSEEGDLKDKLVKFEVELMMGSKSVPHPIDEDLATKVGAQSLQDLKDQCSKAASNRINVLNTTYLFDQVSARLTSENDFIIPQWLVSGEAGIIAKREGMELDSLDDDSRNHIFKIAENSVRLSLILDYVRSEEPEAQLNEDEVFNILKRKIKENHPNQSESEVLMNLINSNEINNVFTAIKDEFVYNFIIKNSTVVE